MSNGYGSLGSGTFGLDDNYLGSLSKFLPNWQGMPAMNASGPAPWASAPGSIGFNVGEPAGLSGWGKVQDWFKTSGVLDSVDLNTNQKTQGWGGLALGAGSALMNGFMGMQNYGLARDQFNESKDQFNRNFAATQKTTNTALEDRQRARVNSSVAGAYQSVGDYMEKNRV
jgi:hypothetical protein